MASPVPTSFAATVPAQTNVVPYLGFPPSKKPRFEEEADFGRESEYMIIFNTYLPLSVHY